MEQRYYLLTLQNHKYGLEYVVTDEHPAVYAMSQYQYETEEGGGCVWLLANSEEITEEQYQKFGELLRDK